MKNAITANLAIICTLMQETLALLKTDHAMTPSNAQIQLTQIMLPKDAWIVQTTVYVQKKMLQIAWDVIYLTLNSYLITTKRNAISSARLQQPT